jgi:hypothetical protein
MNYGIKHALNIASDVAGALKPRSILRKSNSADRMRRLEEVQGWNQNKHSREDNPFVRSTASGNCKTPLPEASMRLIKERWDDLMGYYRMRELLGYLP